MLSLVALQTPASSVKEEETPVADSFADLDPSDPALAAFSAIFEKFQLPEGGEKVSSFARLSRPSSKTSVRPMLSSPCSVLALVRSD
jgi:hypothetical protein